MGDELVGFGRMGCCGKPEGCTNVAPDCTLRAHPAKHGKGVKWGQTACCGRPVWLREAYDGGVSRFELDGKTAHSCEGAA